MNYTGKNHTFAICAYKESPFLEECIQSLLGQTIPSTIIIVTSTDNAYIQNMAEKSHLELFIITENPASPRTGCLLTEVPERN